MANRPLLVLETFSGERRVDEWIPHFENVAAELEVYTKTGPGRKAHVGGEATATVRDTDEDKLDDEQKVVLDELMK